MVSSSPLTTLFLSTPSSMRGTKQGKVSQSGMQQIPDFGSKPSQSPKTLVISNWSEHCDCCALVRANGDVFLCLTWCASLMARCETRRFSRVCSPKHQLQSAKYSKKSCARLTTHKGSIGWVSLVESEIRHQGRWSRYTSTYIYMYGGFLEQHSNKCVRQLPFLILDHNSSLSLCLFTPSNSHPAIASPKEVLVFASCCSTPPQSSVLLSTESPWLASDCVALASSKATASCWPVGSEAGFAAWAVSKISGPIILKKVPATCDEVWRLPIE